MSRRSQVTGHRSQVTRIILLSTLCLLLTTLTGCEAFVRKFTRKPKEIKREEPIIEPQVYPETSVSKEQLYMDYYLFWQTWSDEALLHLNENDNAKKQKECAYEALDNLLKMQSLLSEQKAKAMEPLVAEFKTVKEIVFAGRLNGPDYEYLRLKVERIKSRLSRNFSFLKIRKDLL
ncbi:MAG: hypothetical protein A2Y00_00475 [Omnitrophica WOR_2 bacterium GWF2_43_52]|nr:MAG: hypothetical protein A2062_01955 [Omnitrophica WOR_2 bacterium GWA2_44_7]OGX14424.1 MAG: hypothetical protein A2Y01_07650 [Omnitrophica WOR_2 bacterium GWC2_44_8]OGX20939.1 MAG: hypothetical protein A2Y00_00475 [Omnitrophica WOR_2 bacterium GWF2_43_52]HAH21117.1 hypothetical protein [Candidatus Omnitrophota bacterium]HBG63281.1 hypothetical protein [Candidatus Omnitrophota bacterium]